MHVNKCEGLSLLALWSTFSTNTLILVGEVLIPHMLWMNVLFCMSRLSFCKTRGSLMGPHPEELRVNELLTGLFVPRTTFLCPYPHGCPTENTHHSHGGAGSPMARQHRVPEELSLKSSSLQPNCCELQTAPGSWSSREGSRPSDLVFYGVIHGWPLGNYLHLQKAQSLLP